MLRSWLIATFGGGGLMALFLIIVFPGLLNRHDLAEYRLQGAVGVPIYVAMVGALLLIVRRRLFAPVACWLSEDRPPTNAERRAALMQPAYAVLGAGPGWLGAAVIFGAIGATHALRAGLAIGVTIVLGGLASLALGYLLLERTLRPVTALALAGAPREQVLAPGVTTRLVMAWGLGTAGPVLGALGLSVWYLAGGRFSAREAFASIVFLAVVAIAVGLVAILVAARSVADPVAAMRGALGRVEEGDFDARVAIDDASEVGLLQAGFNRMAEGLAERERIREAFGTYVDKEVAEHILREGTSLAGEQVEVTMMFLDIRNFTGFSERSTAPEVVATVNRLWERVVPIIHAHGGHVDKFVGDGLLAVFGAPRRQPDHADQALSAALDMAAAVEKEFAGDLGIGIGLNSGTVVAGNVGGAGRLEFSVIGDAVNVAARVESATRQTGDVILVSEHTKRLLHDDAIGLEDRPQVPLKGKTEIVRLYAPAKRG